MVILRWGVPIPRMAETFVSVKYQPPSIVMAAVVHLNAVVIGWLC